MSSTELLSTRDPDRVLDIARVRDRFLNEPGADLSALRPVVARSWYRSKAAGVDAISDRGISDEGRVDLHTLKAAEPLLGKLDDFASDMGGYVSLTAPNGVLVNPSFLRAEEEFPVGYSLLEENCGSNGEGLAIEEGRGVWLAPEEHFREDMRGNWCFASLIRDPFQNRIRAVIGLTFPAERVGDIDPSSTLLMLESVATRIGREIEARTSAEERNLLNEYLTVSRRRGGAAVLAIDGKNTLMNSTATSSLEEGDFSVVSSYAKGVMTSAQDVSCEVTLRGPGAVTLEISPVQIAPAKHGAIVVIRPCFESGQTDAVSAVEPVAEHADGDVDSSLASGFDGISTELHRTLTIADKAIVQMRSAAVVGESGTGKERLARAIARRFDEYLVVDCQGSDFRSSGLSRVLERVVEDASLAVVLKNADSLLRKQAQELVRALKGRADDRVIMTITRPTDVTQFIVEAFGMLEIAVAPLRSRREDVPELAKAFAREMGGPELSRRLLTALMNSDWPRNIDQLRAVVSNAVECARGSEVTVDDLPQGFHSALTNGRLSRLEDAELSELRNALQEAKGNRRLAAQLLQIGRSTLYRRMDYFRGRGFEL